MPLKFIAIFLLTGLFLFSSATTEAQSSQWRPVSGSRQANISGMALVDHLNQKTTFIIVNDNKKKEQSHAALITVDGKAAPLYIPLKWLGDDVPTDLESITSIPGAVDNFMAFTSAGRIYHILLDRQNNSVKLLKSFDAPVIPSGSDFEGFALQQIGGTLLAVWADRGLDAKPATLFWSKLNLQNYTFSQTNSAPVKVPYPLVNVRHISDVKIDETGAVFIASAADPGNDGPFTSAIYYLGIFSAPSGSNQQPITFTQAPFLTRLFSFDYHKIEALEFVPGSTGGIAFGTDDENLGQ